MTTRRELSELVHGLDRVATDPMGRPLAARRQTVLVRWLRAKLPDPGTFDSEYERWAAEILDGTLDLGEVARAIDEIGQAAKAGKVTKGRGAIFNFRRCQWLKRKGA